MLPSPHLLRQVVRQAPLRHGITQGYARLPLHLRIKGASQARGFTVANGQPSSSSSSSWGRAWRAARLRARQQTRRCNSSQATDGTKPTTLSGRMKEMSRKYGWTVTGIYLGLSVLDFPFCFLAVKWFGTERVAEIEHTIMDGFWNLAERAMPSLKERRLANEAATAAEDAAVEAREAGEQVAEQAKHKNPGLGTQLILAYGVHKSLIFFRIPLTLAITPKVVKKLRSWGWQIGKQKPKSV
ncbi:uncharacterized protein SEPMUDRAFT_152008 [Sphaerulina musiva SO2202]|uniref:DUF1279 domain-containing protein n=1 Tax=Sphaerulina musiva (strain SO2202) TaxID=692275 RepID=M3C8W7_SPHMS|nr:uncharacterized protein SEPMUDRAFT_152008 [Sphaerulina musiva SO2202]EMF08315.1 hypothetical protein SEPMUDRAFT_152008 [Sphaerulina musiva SO2202]